MGPQEPDCSETLIDLVCYEIQTRRLSPEMRKFFDWHLEKCAACRRRVGRFKEILIEPELKRNFG